MSVGRRTRCTAPRYRLPGWGLLEGSVEAPPEEKFRIFVSHKHEDHELAMTVRAALQRLGAGKVECFVSGVDISAGADWNRQIKARLAQSHLLVLLFTSPSENWDWCLYEAGLFTRFDVEDVSAIVCLFNPETGSPRPLANLQGVAAQPVAVERFLEELFRKTWCISDDWRRGHARRGRGGRARPFGCRRDRERVPEGNVGGAVALPVPPGGARSPMRRPDRFDHPGIGPRRRRRGRDIGFHALAVQPRRRAAHAHLARSGRGGRRRRCRVAPSARSTVRRRAQRRALHADLGDVTRRGTKAGAISASSSPCSIAFFARRSPTGATSAAARSS